jgi:hypothetical protein
MSMIPEQPNGGGQRETEEVDLAIPNIHTEEAVKRGSGALSGLPGILGVRVIERGAFVRYDPKSTTKDEICHAFEQAGFRASVFQDSRTGDTGQSSH